MNISYVTGNKSKYENAKKFFAERDIEIEQQALSVPEIQGSDCVEIAVSKAKEAWRQVGKPLFINDASWSIPALGGFPGPYMKYINQWFEPVDFIHLMEGKKDRTIILKDVIVYIDGDGHTVFTNEHPGVVLEQIAEIPCRHPSDAVISLSSNGMSVGEEISRGAFFIEDEDRVWEEFAGWLKNKNQ